MAQITGTFTYGAAKTIAVTLDYDGDERAIVAADLTLHLSADQRGEADAFTGETPRIFGAIVYDRDPSHAYIEAALAPRGQQLAFTVSVTVDGHTIAEHGVTGGETNLAWRTELPPRTPVVLGTGVTQSMTIEAGTAPAGTPVQVDPALVPDPATPLSYSTPSA